MPRGHVGRNRGERVGVWSRGCGDEKEAVVMRKRI
jgi:hypothetical protein